MEEHYDFITNEAINLSEEQKREILRMICQHNRNLVSPHNDGLRINLSNVPDYLIIKIHNYIEHHMK